MLFARSGFLLLYDPDSRGVHNAIPYPWRARHSGLQHIGILDNIRYELSFFITLYKV